MFKLCLIYIFTGKIRQGFLAQQESLRIAKEIEVSEDDPLYDMISKISQISDAKIDRMESVFQNRKSITSWDKFGIMGKMMGFANRGKLQSYVFFIFWLIFAIPLFILASPFLLPTILYLIWQRKTQKDNQ